MTCVSGSPKRALHSRRTGPSGSQHQARKQGATERAPATGQLGQDRPVERVAAIASTRSSGRSSSGLTRPSRRCSARGPRRSSRLWSRATGSARVRPAVAEGDHAGLGTWSRSSTTTQGGRGPRACAPAPSARDRPFRFGAGVTHRHALAGRESIRLHDDARSGGGQLAPRRPWRPRRRANDARAGHPDARRARDLVTERLARLDRAAAARRAKDCEARFRERVGHAGLERRLRADDDELGGGTPRARATTAAGSSGSTPGSQRTRGSSAIASLPGATVISFTPGSPASFQASACSRPPPPTTTMRVGIDRGSCGQPRRGGASAARPARSSGSAPVPPTRGRSGPRHVPRSPRRSAVRSLAGRPASGRR